MCQVGCYLLEYCVICVKVGSFLVMVKMFDIVCEVILQLLCCFDLDVVILFLDIFIIFDVMGLELYFVDGEGFRFCYFVCDVVVIVWLVVLDMEIELCYVMDVVCVICCEFDGKVLLIGFFGSLWMLVCYMVEGGGSKDFVWIKVMVLNELVVLYQLLLVVIDVVIVYLVVQCVVGVQVLQVFDIWGGVFSFLMYCEFLLCYLICIVQVFECGQGDQCILLILFGKGIGLYLGVLVDIGVDVFGVDWILDLFDVVVCIGGCVVLQGNFDFVIFYGNLVVIECVVGCVFDSYVEGNGGLCEGYVFNLGYGMLLDMNFDYVGVLVDVVYWLSWC